MTAERGIRLQLLTVAHGLAEGSASLFAAGGTASVALLGFGLDSLIEVFSAAIMIWRLTSIIKPGRLTLSERNGLRCVGIGFLGLALTILADASQSLLYHEAPRSSVLGIVVAAISILLMPILARAKRLIGANLGSPSMQADAKQSNFCAYLAAITLLGLLLNRVFGWWWADSTAALFMTPIMVHKGIQALKGHACGCCGI